MVKEQREREETVEKNETGSPVISDELAKRMETASARLEKANAQFEANKALEAAERAEQLLGGQSEAGSEPIRKTDEELKKEDVQNVFPNDLLPKNLRK